MYQFCPTCGTKLVAKSAGDDGDIPYCEHCARFWFPTFPDCVIVLIANAQHEIVLAKMPYLSERYESLISGYIKPDENAEQASCREVQEELGNAEWVPVQDAPARMWLASPENSALDICRQFVQKYA